jgi:hypothetical protein
LPSGEPGAKALRGLVVGHFVSSLPSDGILETSALLMKAMRLLSGTTKAVSRVCARFARGPS